jgi:YcaO-like protein with predicted kinase domain
LSQTLRGEYPETRGFASPYLDRTRAPDETVALMRPRFADFGITRLARVTGLDVIGIPVWSAIRPNSRTLAVSQGKGLDDSAAMASAAMEAIEVATAERADLPHRTCSANDIAAEGGSADLLSGLLRAGATAPEPAENIDWIAGYDLLHKAPVWVPLDAATLLDARVRSRYWQSTDGLASGNILWEAIVHGLCERIERDALALWSLRNDAQVAACCRDPHKLDDPELRKLVALIEGAALQLRLFDIASDIGVPAFLALISPAPNGQEASWKHFDLSSGSGCHPNRVRAILRAVTEAAQTRLTTISAIRDDFDPEKYETKLNVSLLPYIRLSPAGQWARESATAIDRSVYLDFMVERLRAVGVRSIIVVPLEAGEAGYAVAKVLVPDFENPPGDRRFPYGRRAVRAMLAAA